jgi:Uma2 family endonuclease
MATVLSPPDQRVLLDNITWEVYESLLAAHRDRSVPRFIYDRGQLEIMSPSAAHEQLKETVTLLVNIVAEEKGINAEGFGSTTFRRADLARGFEPDACFYIDHLGRVKGKTEIDLRSAPTPDLVIEIDLTSPSLNKFAIFAHLGVPEVWRYDGERMHMYRLAGTEYVEQAQSLVLRGLTSSDITRFLTESRTLARLVWLRRVREWART